MTDTENTVFFQEDNIDLSLHNLDRTKSLTMEEGPCTYY